MELAEFLLARIAEDEEAARKANGESWRHRSLYRHPTSRQSVYGPDFIDQEVAEVEHTYGWHIARHDPARVLAECEAKRRIVEAYEKNRDRIETNASDHTKASARGDLSALPTMRSAGWDLGGRDWALEITLRLLALPYADHSDYREEWRP